MRLAMTLLTRDCADIIEANLKYHRAQGVDLFVVGDDGSVDGTLEILERFERGGLVKLEPVSGELHEVWSKGRTKLARLAHELGADWVIHNDQDEFWWSLTGDLKETLAVVPDRFGLVVAPRTEFVGRHGEGSFAERLTVREARFLRPPKAAHRTHPRIVLDHPHPTRIGVQKSKSEPKSQADVFAGRPGLRGASAADHSAELKDELVFAPTFPVRVLHFPVRSAAQYRHRVELTEKAGLLESKSRQDLRTAYEAGALDDVYTNLILDDEAVARGIEEGTLVEDTDFRDYLAACPDPLEGGASPPGSRSWSEERRQRELAELQFDGMRALTRYVRRRGEGDKSLERRRRLRHKRRMRRRSERLAESRPSRSTRRFLPPRVTRILPRVMRAAPWSRRRA
jgi:hypothetical protein